MATPTIAVQKRNEFKPFDEIGDGSVMNRLMIMATGMTGITLLEDYGIRSSELKYFLDFVEQSEHIGVGEPRICSLNRDGLTPFIESTDKEYIQLREVVGKVGLANENTKIHTDDFTLIIDQITKVEEKLKSLDWLLTGIPFKEIVKPVKRSA